MPLLCIFLPCFRLIGAILLGGFLSLVSVSASATTCTNTSNGALNDPAIYGKFQNSRQDAGCGSDLSLNYTVAPGTNVSWDGVGGVLRGGLVNQGTLNLHAPVELEGFLKNEGTLNLISKDSSAEVNFKGGWVNRGTFSADSVVLHWQEASRIEDGTVELTSVSLKVSGKVQKIGGNLNASSSNLELSGRTEWMVPESLTFSRLDLNGNTLLLGDNETELQFSQQVSLNHSSDQIILGRGSLKLDGGLQLEQGYLSVSGGSLELSGASKVESDGLLNLADGRFVLQSPFTVKGTLRMNSGTDIQGVSKISLDGGILESSGNLLLDQLEFQGKSHIRLLADTEIDSASPISLETIEFQKNHLRLVSETTDLTLDNLTLESSGEKGLDTGLADLTVSGSMEVVSGRLSSSGGALTFSGTTQFDPVQSILELDNSRLSLSSSVDLSSVLRLGGNSLLPGNDLLTLYGASIELGGNLNLEGIKTDNTTFVELKDNSSIRSNRPIELGRLMPHGHTLELGSAETELSLLGIGEPPELPEGNGNPTINLSPVIESLNAERLQDGSLKWSVVISDDSAFSSISTHWEYLFGAPRNFNSPAYTSVPGSQTGTVEVVMSDYDDSDSGMLLLTVCDQASDHDGECDFQKEGATTLNFELIPYAYELPLICEDQDCTQTLDGPPPSPVGSLTEIPAPSSEDNQAVDSVGGSILLKGGVLQIQEKLTLSGSLIKTGGGSLVLHDGALLNQGSSLKLDNGTLELGDNLELDNSTLHADASVLRLLDHVSLVMPADMSFKEIQLQQKTLTLYSSVTSLTLNEQLILDHAQAGIIRNQAQLVFQGGVKIAEGGIFEVDDASKIQINLITLDGGLLKITGNTNESYSQNTEISVSSPSMLEMDENLNLNFQTLSLSSDLQITFGSETTNFRVNRLVLKDTSKLSGNSKSKLVVAFPDLTQSNAGELQIQKITLETEECLDHATQEKIVLLDGGILEIGNLQEITGIQELVGEIVCPVKLNQAKICINDDVTIKGDLILNGDAEIHIAPQKTLSYQGRSKVTLLGKHLSILGGGSFVSNQDFVNGIGLNDNLSRLSIGAVGTSISHVSINDSSGAVLGALKTWTDVCNQGDGDASESGSIENLEHSGSFQIELETGSRFTLNDHLRILDNQTVAVGGSGDGNFVLGDNASLAGTLLLKASATLSGGTIKFDGGRLEVEENSNIESSIQFQKQGGTISLDAGKSLSLESNLGIGNGQNLSLEGGANANLKFKNGSHLQNQGTLKLDAENLTLTGDNVSFEAGSQLLVVQSATFTNTPFNLSGAAVEIQENAGLTFDNSTVELSQSSIDLQTGASLQFDNSSFNWQGQLSKTGDGSLSFDEVRLTGDASYLGSSQASIRLLNLDNHGLALES
ncbi:MAG TPA: hypothetical protein QF683_17470, partial [SAR324 cluster bacterium]|nr:hypothetical protein [SAR324 cluster bacterium]